MMRDCLNHLAVLRSDSAMYQKKKRRSDSTANCRNLKESSLEGVLAPAIGKLSHLRAL